MITPNSNGTGPTFYPTTLACSADGTTSAYFVPEGRNCKIQVEVATGDDAGVFYVRTKARKSATAVRHTTLFYAKTAGNSLNVVLDYVDGSGWVEVEYDRTSGTTNATATVTFLLY